MACVRRLCPLRNKRTLPYPTYCDTGPRFSQSKDPTPYRFVASYESGIPRTCTNTDPHRTSNLKDRLNLIGKAYWGALHENIVKWITLFELLFTLLKGTKSPMYRAIPMLGILVTIISITSFPLASKKTTLVQLEFVLKFGMSTTTV